VVGVEYDGVRAEPPKLVKVVEDLLEAARAGEPFWVAGW
jgi:hypothetical protein